ncbi:hypothetical protein BKA80DRAFT_122644 [Phyllosticta citrichinensis]
MSVAVGMSGLVCATVRAECTLQETCRRWGGRESAARLPAHGDSYGDSGGNYKETRRPGWRRGETEVYTMASPTRTPGARAGTGATADTVMHRLHLAALRVEDLALAQGQEGRGSRVKGRGCFLMFFKTLLTSKGDPSVAQT